MRDHKARTVFLFVSLIFIIFALLIQDTESKGVTPVCLYHRVPDKKTLHTHGPIDIWVTSYNPEEGQTDDAPCTGASNRDLCLAAREGDRTIALSRDLIAYYGLGGTYRWHDKVVLTSPTPGCNGVFSVEDTMHERFSLRGDIFSMDRKNNVGLCKTVTLSPF